MSGSFERKVVGLLLGLATAALFTFLVVFGTNTFIPHDDFNTARNDCYQKYNPYPYPERPYDPDHPKPDLVETETDLKECLDAIEKAEDDFRLTQSVAALLVGVLGMIAGTFLMRETGGVGLVLGGLASTVFGLVTGGQVLGGMLIFVVVLVVFLLVLVLSRKFVNMSKKV